MKILYLSIRYEIEQDGLYQNLVNALITRQHSITIVRSKYDISETKYEKN